MVIIQIVVATQYLRNLANDTRRTTEALRRFTALKEDKLDSARQVERAYRTLSHKWDERREKLAQALDEVATSLDTAADEFDRLDSEMASAVQVDE